MDDIERTMTKVMHGYVGRVINQTMLDQLRDQLSKETGLPAWATSPPWASKVGTIFAGVRGYRATMEPGLAVKVRTVTGESLE